MMVVAPMRLAKAAVPYLAASERGSFVAIGGSEAAQPRAPFPLGPTRAALQGFIKLLADQYGPTGVRFNTVAPGLMDNAEDEFHPNWKASVPLARYGRSEEVGQAVAYLVSEKSSYVTGQCLTVDGGMNRPLGL